MPGLMSGPVAERAECAVEGLRREGDGTQPAMRGRAPAKRWRLTAAEPEPAPGNRSGAGSFALPRVFLTASRSPCSCVLKFLLTSVPVFLSTIFYGLAFALSLHYAEAATAISDHCTNGFGRARAHRSTRPLPVNRAELAASEEAASLLPWRGL